MTFPAAPAAPVPPSLAVPGEDQPFRSVTAASTPQGGLAETQRLLADGLIRPVIADVFVARDVPDSQRLRALSAALLIPPGRREHQAWVVGFMSAAWVYTGRWPRPDPAGDDPPGNGTQSPRLDVIIAAGSNRPADPWVRARQGRLTSPDVVLIHGLALSDPVRTAADLARELSAGPALELLRWLGELNQVRPQQVLHRLSTMRYARGAARARAIVGTWQHQG